jgi:hypothetical protein
MAGLRWKTLTFGGRPWAFTRCSATPHRYAPSGRTAEFQDCVLRAARLRGAKDAQATSLARCRIREMGEPVTVYRRSGGLPVADGHDPDHGISSAGDGAGGRGAELCRGAKQLAKAQLANNLAAG